MKIKLALYWNNFGPEKGQLGVLLPWLVLVLFPSVLMMSSGLLGTDSTRFLRDFAK
jgi:hypothetical protein